MTVSNRLIVALRVSLGWLFLYSGTEKILDSHWTAGGFLAGAKTFTAFYAWFASPAILPLTNWLNSWGQFLIGAALLLGICVRFSSICGAVLMALYYFPGLTFPTIGKNYLLVDEHVIFALALLLLASARAGRYWGLDAWCANLPVCKKYPRFHNLFG